MLGIVPEELKEENYEFWKICLKSYLVGQGLWDVVSKDAKPNERGDPEWEKKNAKALHAIQLACGSRVYSKYKRETHISAKYAWDHLAEKYQRPRARSHSMDHEIQDHPNGNQGRKDYIRYEALYTAAQDGDYKTVKNIINRQPDAITAIISSHGDTALHIAILAGQQKTAMELVKLMPPHGLEMANEFGATPLSLAAISGETKLAREMVLKNHKLVTIANEHDEGLLPVIVASEYGRKRMVHYLYSKTPKEEFNPNHGLNGSTLLNCLVTAEFYDVASMLVKMFPKLGVTGDHHGNYTLRILAHKPSAFPSGSTFVFWKYWIYLCVRIHSPWDASKHEHHHQDHTETHMSSGPEHEHIIDIDETSEDESDKRPPKAISLLYGLGWTLLRCFDVKHIHDRKLINDEATKLLSCIFKEIRGMSDSQLEKMEIDKAIYDAIKHGIVEFVVEILEYNPEFIWRKDKKGRTIFSHAIVLRQEKIFSLIYRLGTKKSIVACRHDIFGNNFLHLAAKLSPPTQLERVSGAALQMQRELQWFKEVESIVQPKYKDQVNENNRKPSTLFTEEHKELAKEGERWMKNTAGSSMIVGTLIAAVMFTTAFTVPGGNNQTTGLPVMLDHDAHAFFIFMVSNALSMFTSSTSVLMFLGILTARYAEKDFLKSLPTKLIFGLSCLFFSIVTMMVSFGSSLYLILHKKLSWVSIPIIVLSTFPVFLFSVLQFPLLLEMIYRTYVSSIFDKPKNHTFYGISNKLRKHPH